jgi:hypothetical protein
MSQSLVDIDRFLPYGEMLRGFLFDLEPELDWRCYRSYRSLCRSQQRA